MIKYCLVTGDTHAETARRLAMFNETVPDYEPSETAIIILGDVGFHWYHNKKDWKLKHQAAEFGYTLYCLRGNHEDRAANTKDIEFVYDDFVHGYVYVEKEFPNIKYFSDEVAEYEIMGKSILCIPGAYSIDKWYRLQMGWQWFAQEQLTAEEMARAEKDFCGKHYDLVLSHTCPIDWEPSDLFLRGIDQSKVDKTMEVWMKKFRNMINWGIWLFAHYHTDRLERPHVEIFYEEVENLDVIFERWEKYDNTGEVDWWIPLSPNFKNGEG